MTSIRTFCDLCFYVICLRHLRVTNWDAITRRLRELLTLRYIHRLFGIVDLFRHCNFTTCAHQIYINTTILLCWHDVWHVLVLDIFGVSGLLCPVYSQLTASASSHSSFLSRNVFVFAILHLMLFGLVWRQSYLIPHYLLVAKIVLSELPVDMVYIHHTVIQLPIEISSSFLRLVTTRVCSELTGDCIF